MRAMVRVFLYVSGLIWYTSAGAQTASDVAWVQIEARPTLTEAVDRAREWDEVLDDVNGFSLDNGWYGIALGPYTVADAEQVLAVYKAQRFIPPDSYINYSTEFGQQFWPASAEAPAAGLTGTPLPSPAAPSQNVQQSQAEAQAFKPADETESQARLSEAQLTREEREELQIALRWAGFYNSAIDGAFGRGTRGSMADWQASAGYEPTGILTTGQRAELLREYNGVLEGMDMRVVRDLSAGIEMEMPTAVLRFDRYEYPFAHYTPTGRIDAQLLLISQPGDRTTLAALYEILQTLEIVPLDGPRDLGRSGFEIEGRNARMVSYSEAALQDGEIKGFMVVWPAGDEERRRRILDEMQASFTRTFGVLDPSQADDAAQAVDLVAGLQVRKPRLTRSGFFVDADGTAVTTLDAVRNCTRITLDDDTTARMALADDRLGIALLAPEEAITPLGYARFAERVPRLQSEVALAGYSYGGALGAPSMTFGTLIDIRGLEGEADLRRLEIDALEGDAGGPVIDEAGGVMGMLLPHRDGARQLPDAVNFAASAEMIREMLAQAGKAPEVQLSQAPMAPEDITEAAQAMTVLVGCWN